MDIQKKIVHALEQEREDILKHRQDWFDDRPDRDPRRLVFIDETSLSTKRGRLQGRALREERCGLGFLMAIGKPRLSPASLRLTGMTAPFVHEGSAQLCGMPPDELVALPYFRPVKEIFHQFRCTSGSTHTLAPASFFAFKCMQFHNYTISNQ